MQVVFSRSNADDLSGKVTWLSEAEESLSMKKIVFIAGYKADKHATWKGPLPEDGEEWECEFVRDTNPDDPKKGALIVHLMVRAKVTTALQPIGQLVGGVRRHNLVTSIGRRDIVTSDYRAENETTKELRRQFIKNCEKLAPLVIARVQLDKRHDVVVDGVEVTDAYVEDNTLYYRVDNIKVRRHISKVYEGNLVIGLKVMSLYRLVQVLGIPRIQGDIAVFPTPVGDFKLLCDASAYTEHCKLEIIGVTNDKGRRLVLLATAPWGLRTILEHSSQRLDELSLTAAQMDALRYLLCVA